MRAEALRADAGRRRAADFAWRARAWCDAAAFGSRFSACLVARDRRDDVFRDRPVAAREADLALRFVPSVALAGGGGSFTPA